MKPWCATLALGMVCWQATGASAQEEVPDYRIRAQLRDAADESIGNATVKVISRYLKVYYGGVSRNDEYRFQLEIDSSSFADRSFDVLIDDYLVGSHTVSGNGFLDVTYRSDYKPDDAPDLPLPQDFPGFVDIGSVLSLVDASSHELLLTSLFGEEFERGDSDQDGDVDSDDYLVWESGYGGRGFGPTTGEYSGDDRVGGEDLLHWQRGFSGDDRGRGGDRKFAAVPEPASIALASLCLLYLVRRRS
ncbi:MAG: hypothetical protein KDA61_05325 [Planctomycetales bacterium]|nr:hypothetical protein [Planctomycetales bacterium]